MSGPKPGQVVLITGAAGGIGRAAVLAFARAGARVVAADLDEAGAQQAADLARAEGAEALAVQADVASSASVQAMVAAAVARFGRLDAAFNNAGVELEGVPTHEADEDLFDRSIAINLKGVFLCMKYQLRQMLAQGGGGVIVNTASVAGLVGAATMPAYAASKHGVVGLTKSAALEYAKKGIRVNAVCPGVIRTAMTERAVAQRPEREAFINNLHPMGRIGEPDEIAATALWLCSPAASFITGQALAVDGGMLAR
jgi:NAD(P)-dependent dehydrogenase (short-subunit alcohol dehydrogenase family)